MYHGCLGGAVQRGTEDIIHENRYILNYKNLHYIIIKYILRKILSNVFREETKSTENENTCMCMLLETIHMGIE
jgi:hypothetical protein